MMLSSLMDELNINMRQAITWHIYHHIIYVDKQNNYISLYMYIMYMKWMFKIRINPGSIHNNIFFQFSIFFSISNFYHIIALH